MLKKVNELAGESYSPPREEGGCDINKMARSEAEQTGGRSHNMLKKSILKRCGVSDHPALAF